MPDDYDLTKRSDLSISARATAIGIRQLDRFESWSGGSLSALARKFVTTRERAQQLAQLIEQSFVTSGESLPDRLWNWLRGG